MRSGNGRAFLFSAYRTSVATALGLTFFAAFLPYRAFAVTVRTKADLRLWETVTDRAGPLSWAWEPNADSARLTFSNRLTQVVSSANVLRTAGATRGNCPHPVPPSAEEALVVATLVQSADGIEISRETAELAYVPGAAGCAMTVRTKADREWRRVRSPRLSAFDARWWNAAGPSGYEVLWTVPAGPHRVVREFEGAGVVDEVVLWFGTLGFLIMLR